MRSIEKRFTASIAFLHPIRRHATTQTKLVTSEQRFEDSLIASFLERAHFSLAYDTNVIASIRTERGRNPFATPECSYSSLKHLRAIAPQAERLSWTRASSVTRTEWIISAHFSPFKFGTSLCER